MPSDLTGKHAAPAADAYSLHSSIRSPKIVRSSMRSVSRNLSHRFSVRTETAVVRDRIAYQNLYLVRAGNKEMRDVV